MVEEWGGNEFSKLLDSCERTVATFETKYKRPITARELLMRQRKIKDTEQAKKILDTLKTYNDPQSIADDE